MQDKKKNLSMANKILDIYSDYLICQNKYATAVATATNHFAIKYKLLVAANIASMNELTNLRKNNVFA